MYNSDEKLNEHSMDTNISSDTKDMDDVELSEKEEQEENDSLKGTPLPPDAPKNWSAGAAFIILIVGLVVGFVVPVIGFLFYIFAGLLALIFSLISVITFKKYGLPGMTVGVLICSLFLLFWGCFHLAMFTTTIFSVISFLQESGITIDMLSQLVGT